MKDKIIIAASPADIEATKAFLNRFEGRNVDVDVLEVSSDTPIDSQIEIAPNMLLWLSPRSEECLYDLGKRRSEKGLKSINLLGDRFPFSPEQRMKVGRNATVIIPLSKEDIVSTIFARLNREMTSSISQTSKTPSETVEKQEVRDHSQESNAAHSPSDSTKEGNSEGLSPLSTIVADVVVFAIGGGIIHYFHISIGNILAYIINLAMLFLLFSFQLGLKDWRNRKGKTFFSWIALLFTWGMMVLIAYSMLDDAYRYFSLKLS